MTAASRLARAIVAVAVPVVLTACSARALATQTFLHLEYGRPGFPAAPGIGDDERLALAWPSTRFIVVDEPPSALAELSLDGRPLYTESEIGHLVDVRVFLRRLMLAAAVAGAVTAAYVVERIARGRGAEGCRALADGGRLAVLIVVVVGAAIATAWSTVFTGFHELFFPPGTWQFPADSGLIRLFPERFWLDTALVLAGLTAMGGLVVAVAAGRCAAGARDPVRAGRTDAVR